MFFTASKIFWLLCAPSHVIVWCSVLAAILLLAGRRRAGTGLAIAAAALLVMIGIVPSYHWLGRPLESRFDGLVPPAHADGILVLGGGGQDIYRLPAAYMIARRYPQARLVFSGGPGELLRGHPGADAEHAKDFELALGLAPSRLQLEGRSRNTFENLQFSKELLHPRADQAWILVTSAYHLPRAIEIAQRMGWKFFPWPSNRLTARHGLPDWFEVASNLENFDMLMRERIGLAVYRWRGYSSSSG